MEGNFKNEMRTRSKERMGSATAAAAAVEDKTAAAALTSSMINAKHIVVFLVLYTQDQHRSRFKVTRSKDAGFGSFGEGGEGHRNA